MTNKYTMDDIPMILNSISWQLKRIADALETDDHIGLDEVMEETTPPLNPNSKIRELLRNLHPNRD